MTKHLLQIHIGPMQTFIAAARRTRDLWFGSWLMSELSKAAARGVAEQNKGNQLIFPAPEYAADLAEDTLLGVSNKVVALTAEPSRAAKAAETALGVRYDALIANASLQSKLNKDTWQRANEQLHSFLEFYWVSCPINDNYPHARAYADALLAARKNCRDFEPVSWDGAGLPKSSLNGRMETVTPKKEKRQTQKQYAQAMYKKFCARPAEQLSGVDLLKRLGENDNDKSRFPSTSHMAAMPLKAKLQANVNDPDVQKKWQDYLRKLPDEVKKQEIIYISQGLRLPILDELDGSLLFESRLLDFMEKKETAVPKKALKKFLQAIDISDPSPYYALLVGDGDSMGKTINGLKTAGEHREFSQKLAQFSQAADAIVKKNHGAVVYAGGDDVLALLPLHTAVSTTATLAQKFQTMMGNLTFSAGIAIVHHLEPLEDALILARKAEKEAKAYQKRKEDGQISKKNALAVVLNKRSGAARMVVGHWGEIDERLHKFAARYRQKELPHGLAYQLRDMFLHLGGQTAVKNNPALQAIITKEAKRIIQRKQGSDDAAAEVAATIQQLDHDKNNIETLSGELIIAAHMAQAEAVANHQSKQEETA